MTKDLAIAAMESGHKVSHKWFTPDEWMKQTGRLYEFEDGCTCGPDEFWLSRDDESWQDDWRIVA